MIVVSEANRIQYERDGYFILERVVPDALVELLRRVAAESMAAIDRDMDAAGVTIKGLNHKNSRYFISAYRAHPELAEFLFSPVMAAICRATLGPEAYLFYEQYVIKSAEKGMAFSWHQDSGYVGYAHRPYLTCWTTLDDVTEENGTVYILPYDRAGTRDMVEHTINPTTNDKVGYFGDDRGIPVIAPAGSVAVFSSTVFHSSGTNSTNQMRRIYLSQYSAEPIIRPNGTPHNLTEAFLRGGEVVRELTAEQPSRILGTFFPTQRVNR